MSPVYALDAWYASQSWNYRKPITITNSGSTVTDYQLSFTLDTETLINETKMQSDCSDLRVTTDESILIPYWIESNNPGCDNANTVIWTKVPSVASGTTTIYVYYGNSSASNQESGEDVFTFFDDFTGSAVSSKWVSGASGTATVSGGYLNMQRSGSDIKISAPINTQSSSVIEYRGYKNDSASFRSRLYFGTLSGTSFSASTLDDAGASGNTDYGIFYDGGPPAVIYLDTWRATQINTTDYYNFKYVLHDSVVDAYYRNRTTDTSIYSNTGLTPGIANGSVNAISLQVTEDNGSQFKLDSVFVRKYVATEPTVGSAGTEQSDLLMSTWQYRRKITFDNSAQNENLTDIPILIRIDSDSIDYANTNDDGSDIVFTDSDGETTISHEIEKWDESGTSYLWVKVPQINASSSTDYIYMYYGNENTLDSQSASGTWDSSYKGVWHMQNTSGVVIADSTSNSNNGTKTVASNPYPTSTGQINGAQQINPSDSPGYISLNSLATTTTFTYSTWIYPIPSSDIYGALFSQQSSIGFFYTGADRKISYFFGGNHQNSSALTENAWHSVVVSVTSGTATFYIDGVADGTVSSAPSFDASSMGNDGISETFKGVIDESRLSTVARSAAYIAAQYKAESGTYNTVGDEELNNASTITWDGGGGDNNFSTCANWSSDVCPTSGVEAVFDSTSTKDATIDSSFGSTIYKITINSGYTGTITLARSLSLNGTFTQSSGTFTTGSQSLTLRNINISGGTFTAGSQNLSIRSFTQSGGTFTASSATISITGNYIYSSGTFNHNSGTVSFVGNTQSITCPTFNSVSFTSSGTKTITNTCTLPLGSSPTLTATLSPQSSLTITGSGTLTIPATSLSQSTSISGFTSTVVGGALTVTGGTLSFPSSTNLTVNGNLTVSSATVNLSALTQADINGNLSFSSSSVFSAPTLLTLSGNFTNSSSTFTHNSGTVQFDGNTDNTITGSTTFYNLKKQSAGGYTLTFTQNTTQTIQGTVTLSGTDVSNRLSLLSASPGSDWYIDPQGTRSIDSVSVQDSNNIHATAISSTNSYNLGNNTNWSDLISALDGYPASDVLGADDFDTSGNLYYGDGLNTELDLVHHRLFVSDSDGGYVYIYNLDENNNLIDKEYDNYWSYGSLPYFYNPGGMAYDAQNNRLFVSDLYENCRVLVYDTSTIEDDQLAVNVLGAPDVNSNGNCTTDDHSFYGGGYDYYGDVAYDSTTQYLYVTDNGNYRVMVFDLSSGITDDMPASDVIGAEDLNSYGPYETTINSWADDNYVNLALDEVNHRLFISSYNDKRVLVFDVSSGNIHNFMDASYVLGQSDFNSTDYTISQSQFGGPVGIEYDEDIQQLFISDDSAERITIYDLSNGITNGMDAMAAIGVPDFDTSEGDLSQIYIYPYDQANLSYDYPNRRLYLGDDYNARVMIYDFIKITKETLDSGTTGSSYSQTITTQNSQGTKAFSVYSGSLPTGLTLNSSTGVLSGTPTVAGTYTFTVKVTDTPGDFGSFLDKKEFTLTVAQGSESNASSVSSPKPEGEYSTTEAPVCSIEKPSSIPSLYQASRDGTGSSMTIYFTPVLVNTQSYLVSYGTDNKAEGYSVSINQPSDTTGAISYTIGSLTPTTTYYVKVKAQNSCASSEFSQSKVSYGTGGSSDTTENSNSTKVENDAKTPSSSFDSKKKTYKGKPYLNFFTEYLNKDNKHKGIALTSNEGDIYYFSLPTGKTVNDMHSIVIDKIDTKNKTVTITIYSTPQTITVTKGQTKDIDVDYDTRSDIQISVDDVLAAHNRQTGLIRVLSLRSTDASNTDSSYGLGSDEASQNGVFNLLNSIKKLRYVWIFIIIVLTAGAYIYLKKLRRVRPEDENQSIE